MGGEVLRALAVVGMFGDSGCGQGVRAGGVGVDSVAVAGCGFLGRVRLSYSKMRAVTRVADRVDERTLLEQAQVHTAAQLERVIRGYRKADGAGLDSSNGGGRGGSSTRRECWS